MFENEIRECYNEQLQFLGKTPPFIFESQVWFSKNHVIGREVAISHIPPNKE